MEDERALSRRGYWARKTAGLIPKPTLSLIQNPTMSLPGAKAGICPPPAVPFAIDAGY